MSRKEANEKKDKDGDNSISSSGSTPTTITPATATATATAGSPTPTATTTPLSPLKGRFNFKNTNNLSATSNNTTSATASTTTPGWIGDGTIPAVGYADLSKPPPFPGRPAPLSRASVDDPSAGSLTTSANTSNLPPPTRVESTSSRKSRTSSTERQTSPMLSTLRNKEPKKQANKKKPSPKRKESRPAASQAAGLAWDNLYRSPSFSDRAASDAALASSRQSTSSEAGFRKDPPTDFRSHSGDEITQSRRHAPVDDPDDRIPGAHWREPRTYEQQAIRRVPVKTPVTTSAAAQAHSNREINPSAAGANAAIPSRLSPKPRSSPKPIVRPKPDVLKSSHQGYARGAPPTEADGSSPKVLRSSRAPNTSSALPSRHRVTPTSSGKVHRSAGNREDELSGAMGRMEVSDASPRRQAKPRATPPSSDPESPGPRSTDAEDYEDGEKSKEEEEEEEEEEDEDDAIMDAMNRLPRGVDVMAARQILNDIVVRGDEVHWDDIAGLEGAKKALKEAVVYPFLRPDLFSGLREPARGMLLFGPPGTGKTMLARAVATESKSTFFSVSASTLTSKWHGDSEKLVRALFGLAKSLAPSIIFVDEIDSLLSARSSGTENEASRRSKTEFLIQWSDLQRAAAGREQGKDNKKIGDASRVLVLAATNMPWDIDEAARRRFVRRQYIPLPEHGVREQQIRKLLSHQVYELSDEDIEVLVHVTDGMYLPPVSFIPYAMC